MVGSIFESFCCLFFLLFFFFFNDTATTEIYTLSLHDALPISAPRFLYCPVLVAAAPRLYLLSISCCRSAPSFITANFLLRQRPAFYTARFLLRQRPRSEEHTSELQSLTNLVCRLLLEKKKNTTNHNITIKKQECNYTNPAIPFTTQQLQRHEQT